MTTRLSKETISFLGHGTGFMNTGLNPDFSESGLDFKNPITSLSSLKQISEFEFEFVSIRIEFR